VFKSDRFLVPPHDLRKKTYFVLGNLCLLSLIAMSAIFYRERIEFCDTAFQTVYLMIEQRPCINWYRPGAIIPLFAIWAGVGIKTVMMLYSMSFLIFFYVMFLLAWAFSRKWILFFVIPLYLVLITGDVFYWPQSELQQGMIWLCIYTILLFEKIEFLPAKHKWAFHFCFILWIQFFHPLMFFPVLFLLSYYYATHPGLTSRVAFRHIALCVAAFAVRYGGHEFLVRKKAPGNRFITCK